MGQRKQRNLGRKAGLAGVIALGGLALAGCDVAAPTAVENLLGMGWPKGVTPEATSMYNFWIWVWVAAWIIGFIMWGLFLTAIFRWNAKKAEKAGKGEFPKQLQYNVPLEMALTIIPILIIMGLFFFTVQAQQKVTALDKNPEVTVDVTAFQWNWKFGYAENKVDGENYDGADAERQKLAEESSLDPEGTPNPNPIHGKSTGDISYLNFNKIETVGTTEEVPVLVLPVDTPIEFRLASGDVSHSFWVPEFLFKRDAYSHPENNSQERRFQVEKIEEKGAFVGRCAEMCGTYHAMMNFEIRVVDRADFNEYLKFREENPQATNAEALEHIGEEPYAVTTAPFNSLRDTRDADNFVDTAEAA
ncbi:MULTISPECIES: aa3-type cytochrome oxidase subunit II [Corynebacterium]|uniref:aa3-type cytochrome oxidase subunit II n=1 Tax=Corynebacterium TaxID=1716 RepID=UPI0008A24C1E|nr:MULTISPECIES: cytochrome c oxidase subunit II [Corynebacterium]OFK66134.1 cytochrome B [Corynebacterium sp. HMSC074A09]OFN78911.1 cytochrome B [Corynebacterium sp. HMSC070E08]OFP31299.1 cytochrome B [Corynebacterium sp. HMSC068G04]OHO52453.1 cytochrome B [Corynebacterium sp. HMSC035E02]PMC71908.1 cytochrome B [Corynebacterium aurimucosum]